jgi:hypothetical protein
MKYTHDASTVDAASRSNPAANQTCANCALVQGNDGDEWRPCQIFPGIKQKLLKHFAALFGAQITKEKSQV